MNELEQILTELRLDPDFAQLPENWQRDTAQYVLDNGLEAAATEMANRAAAEGQAPEFADVRAILGRWANKATQEVAAVNSGGTNMPLEQDVLSTALPGLLTDIDNDAGRRALADRLGGQATQDYDVARNALSPEENARRLAEELAQADATAGRLSGSAATSAADQLTALQASIAAMQQNLTGELAARAAALQQQITALNSNLGTLDDAQKDALAEQISANQANLEASITAQRTALTNEVTALRGAADANSQARAAALQKELDGLTAAQVPMAEARLASANALATGINLGLETERDRMTAQRARQGYLGGSTFDNAAQLRATIGARQGAAQALGQARELNAEDTRAIGVRGATEGRGIADELAGNYLTLAGREATGGRSLSDALATGTQGIADTGAAGRATITNNTALGRFNVGNAGANQSYQDQTIGSSQLRSLLDSLARDTGQIGNTLATQQQGARDAGTTARQGYFDNAYTRGLGGILARPGLSTNLAGTLTSLDNYGQSGLNRSLGTLNWWNTNQNPAPTPGYTQAVASNSGNDIAGLGAGLLGSAFNVANANDWWKKPATTPTPATTPATGGGGGWGGDLY